MYKFEFFPINKNEYGDFETDPFVISNKMGKFDITDSIYDFLESRNTSHVILSSKPFEDCKSATYIKSNLVGKVTLFAVYKYNNEEVDMCEKSLIKLFGEVPKILYFQTYS
jgi:hypothetical protein